MISLRLKTVASLIPNEAEIVNVGTDHALLEIFLAQEKNVKSIGIDINKDSVTKSIKNVQKNNLKEQITILHNDGIKNINVNNKIITISGLGTKTILKILNDIYDNDLIIQSNNNLYDLRKEICKKGYYIYDEKAIFDKKWYVVIYFKKGKAKYTNFELYLGPKINEINYIDYLLKINNKMLENIPKKEIFKRWKIKKIINKLKNCR